MGDTMTYMIRRMALLVAAGAAVVAVALSGGAGNALQQHADGAVSQQIASSASPATVQANDTIWN